MPQKDELKFLFQVSHSGFNSSILTLFANQVSVVVLNLVLYTGDVSLHENKAHIPCSPYGV